jgi:hypothetical protein
MRSISSLSAIAALAAALGLVLPFGGEAPAQAASAASTCKGLAESACKAQTASCTWVAPKKGKQKPYCRAKPAKKK